MSDEMRGPADKVEAIKRLCGVLHKVHEKRVGYGEGPCDCVCPDRDGDPRDWRMLADALEYLEKFAEALPHGKTEVQVTERFRMGEDGRVAYHDLIVEPWATERRSGDPR